MANEKPSIPPPRMEGEGTVCSVCSGSVLPVVSGLLDDKSATTHWDCVDLALPAANRKNKSKCKTCSSRTRQALLVWIEAA